MKRTRLETFDDVETHIEIYTQIDVLISRFHDATYHVDNTGFTKPRSRRAFQQPLKFAPTSSFRQTSLNVSRRFIPPNELSSSNLFQSNFPANQLMKNISVAGCPGTQRRFRGERGGASADLSGLGSGPRLCGLGSRYRQTISPVPRVQAISLPSSAARSWSVYNALHYVAARVRVADYKRERERMEDSSRPTRRNVLRCRAV